MDIRFAKNNFELFPTITNFNKLMNKQQLIESVAKKTGQTKSSTEASLNGIIAVSYTHLRAHETVLDLVCRLLLEKKKQSIH